MRDIDYIVVHCSATSFGKDLDVEDIDRMHKRRGWSGVGYNYVVKLDGTIQNGRPLEKIPAHVKGFNHNSIGICYIGGLDENGKPSDTRTDKQKEALLFKLLTLKRLFPYAKIVGHRDLSPDKDGDGVVERHEWLKSCPCFNASEEYADILL
jgi:N-acetyl-anhydromuramyl-L-alanine amidase AmpD